jgi:hypothetical protein
MGGISSTDIYDDTSLDTITKIKPLHVNDRKIENYDKIDMDDCIKNIYMNAVKNKNRISINYIIDNFAKNLIGSDTYHEPDYCLHRLVCLEMIVELGYEDECIKLLNAANKLKCGTCYDNRMSLYIYEYDKKLQNDIRVHKLNKFAKVLVSKLHVYHKLYDNVLFLSNDRYLIEVHVNNLLKYKTSFDVLVYDKLCELLHDLAIKYLRTQKDSDTILWYACLHNSHNVISYIKESIPITNKMIGYSPDQNKTCITICVVNKMIDEIRYLIPIYYKGIHDDLILVLNENAHLYTDLMNYLAINSFDSIANGKQFYRQIFTNVAYATKITDSMMQKNKFDDTIYDILCELHQELAIKYITINKISNVLLWHACVHKSTIVIEYIEQNCNITDNMIEYHTINDMNCVLLLAQNGLIPEFRMLVKKYYGAQNELIKRFSPCGELLLHVASHNNAPCMRVLLEEWEVQQVFLKELHKEYNKQISDVVELYIISETNTTCDTTNYNSKPEGQI